MRPRTQYLLAAFGIAACALSWRDAIADDETDQVEIKLQAPADAVDCAATPPTVTVLGLVIDLSQISADGSSDDGSTGDSGSGDGSDDGSGGGSNGCVSIVAGQTVEVKLASDTPPLVASEVGGEGGSDAEIKAPVQAVDATNGTITVLGLTVDVSQATMEGDDDEGDGEGQGGQAIDLTQVSVGQFAEIKLDASQLPALVATELSVKNFSNQVEVEVEDSQGEDIGDDDSVDVSVTETVVVQSQTGAQTRRVRKVVHFAKSGNGHLLVVGGLPTGRALITVSSSNSGTTGKRRTKILPNTKRSVRVRLRSH